jgi:hypothetical protein
MLTAQQKAAADAIAVSPGTVLLDFCPPPEEKVGSIIVPQAQDRHAQKLGTHFPMYTVIAVGEIDLQIEAVDKQRREFCDVGDVVWADYRGCGQILWGGKEYTIAPRQYVRGRAKVPVAVPAPEGFDTVNYGDAPADAEILPDGADGHPSS